METGSRIGSGGGGHEVRSMTRGKYRRVARANGTTHGYIPPELAERIFRDALAEWGLSASNEDDRDEILYCLAEVLWASTSMETDFSTVLFRPGGSGEPLSVQPLVNIATRAITAENPLRVWIRSFRQADLAVRIHDFLDTPENINQRQEAAMSYGAELNHARFCFDMADALVVSGREFKTSERNTIASLRIYATSRAQSNAQARGLPQPVQDTSGGKTGGAPAQQVSLGNISPAPTSVRSGFTPVR